MAKNIDLTSQKWLDLIFEGRNHSYGAYVLRQQSSKRHLIAFVFSLTIVTVGILSALMVKKVNDTIERNRIIDVVTVGEYNIPPPPPPEEIIEHRVEVPPPVELAKTISYQVPKIEKDELVNDEQEMKSVDQVIDAKDAIISIIDNEKGRTDGFGVDPADLTEHTVIIGKPVADETIYNNAIVEQSPSFPGGESAMYEWLRKNINYPVIAQENNIQGKVTLQFVVDKNGDIVDIIIARGVDPSLDKEAVRVVKSMPKWIPGKQGGNSVKVRFTLPVQFRLH